jgi:dUTP pyrophosphatase
MQLVFTKTRAVKSPRRGHPEDAGIDFFVPDGFQDTTVYPQEDILIPAGIRCVVPEGFALVAHNKSGVCTKTGLAVGAAVIDSGYRGEVHIHLINTSNHPVIVSGGEKITQFLLVPVSLAEPVEVSGDEYAAYAKTDRGSGGFGSTGVA